jgi:arsenite oxidase small subunit
MSEMLSRRSFLKGSVASGTGAVVGSLASVVSGGAYAGQITELNTGTTLPYPNKVVGKAKSLSVSAPASFNYPDNDSPCQLIKMGKPVTGGVGPDGDIVAYSVICTHQGCPTAYDVENGCFKCPCHFSIFDAEKDGQMVIGQAPVSLPRILLEYDAATDTIRAVGVNGLIYGRQANVLS